MILRHFLPTFIQSALTGQGICLTAGCCPWTTGITARRQPRDSVGFELWQSCTIDFGNAPRGFRLLALHAGMPENASHTLTGFPGLGV